MLRSMPSSANVFITKRELLKIFLYVSVSILYRYIIEADTFVVTMCPLETFPNAFVSIAYRYGIKAVACKLHAIVDDL